MCDTNELCMITYIDSLIKCYIKGISIYHRWRLLKSFNNVACQLAHNKFFKTINSSNTLSLLLIKKNEKSCHRQCNLKETNYIKQKRKEGKKEAS